MSVIGKTVRGKQVLKRGSKYCMIREEIREGASGEGSAAWSGQLVFLLESQVRRAIEKLENLY